MATKKTEQPTFEEAIAQLEQITAQLESGECPLAQSLALFEQGVELTRFCTAALEEAKQKIAILSKDADGAMHAKLFAPEEDDDV